MTYSKNCKTLMDDEETLKSKTHNISGQISAADGVPKLRARSCFAILRNVHVALRTTRNVVELTTRTVISVHTARFLYCVYCVWVASEGLVRPCLKLRAVDTPGPSCCSLAP